MNLSILTVDSEARPLLDFGGGRILRHIVDDTYEWVTLDGKHVFYMTASHVEYESTIQGQILKTRGT